MPMEKYQVIEGRHYERNPNPKTRDDTHIMFKMNDVVESEENLEAKFANKFRKLIPGVNAPYVVTAERKIAVEALIKGGTWSEEDRKFLQELPEDGFARVTRVSAKTGPVGGSAESKNKPGPLGDDVTDSFQQAYDSKLKVWRNAAGKHQVTKMGSPSKPLNPEPLDAAGVEPWVADYLKGK